MNVYLLNRTVIGQGDQFPRRQADVARGIQCVKGINLVSMSHQANLVVAIMDVPGSSDKFTLLTLLQKGLPLWYFYPRGTLPISDVSRAVFGDGSERPSIAFNPLTRFFPYDSSSDIVSWLESSMTLGGMLRPIPPKKGVKAATTA
jgi:hypothetical protein